jgi:hypothetical protein
MRRIDLGAALTAGTAVTTPRPLIQSLRTGKTGQTFFFGKTYVA